VRESVGPWLRWETEYFLYFGGNFLKSIFNKLRKSNLDFKNRYNPKSENTAAAIFLNFPVMLIMCLTTNL